MDYIQQAIISLVEKVTTRDPYEIASAKGISVLQYPFSSINGMVITIDKTTIIALNSNLSDQHKRAVLAHELGHEMLSPAGDGYFFIKENTHWKTKFENEANKFAIGLLTGDEDPLDGETIDQYAARLEIPNYLMKYKYII